MRTLATIISLSLLGCTVPLAESADEPESKTQIIQGVEKDHGEVPSIAALITGGGLCSATMIHPQIALTAAHCIRKPFFMQTIYGVSDVNLVIDENDKDAVIDVMEAVRHEGYGNKNIPGLNDIGLVFLEKLIGDVIFSPIMPAEIQQTALEVGEVVTNCGYGRDENKEVGVLKCVDIPITFQTDLEVMAGLNVKYFSSKGACFGDSGGPLFKNFEGKRYLVADASRLAPNSKGCGHGTVYTATGCYEPWVREKCEEFLDPESCSDFATEVDCDFNDYIKVKVEAVGGGCNYSGGNEGDSGVAFLLLAGLYLARRREES
jgi:MYXO-CTERM domain-containing protein